MVTLFQVRQFVNDDVVQHGKRRQEKPPIEVEVTLARAASPATLLVPDGDPAIVEAELRVPVRRTFSEDMVRLAAVPALDGRPHHVGGIGVQYEAQCAFFDHSDLAPAWMTRIEIKAQLSARN